MTDGLTNHRLNMEPADDGAAVIDEDDFIRGDKAKHLMPRIRIDAFVDESMQTIERLRGDRRVRRAQVEIFDGGLEVAIERYREAPAPDIILVEQRCQSQDVVGLVDRLAEHCPPTARLVLIGDCNDVELYRDLVNAGVSDYLVKPVKPMTLLDSLLGVVEEETAGEALGKVIAFLGVRGGTGASTLSHNVADALYQVHGATTLLVDTDIGFGTAAMQFDIEPPFNLGDALREQDSLTPAMLERHVAWHATRFGVLAAPAAANQIAPPASGGVRRVLDQARRLARFVVVDMPTGISPWTSEIVEIADEICLVGGNDLPSLRNARTFIQILKEARPNDRPARFVINRSPTGGGPVPAAEFKRVLGVEVDLEIEETDIARAAELSGRTLRAEKPQAACVQQIDHLAAMLGGFETPARKSRSSIFSRLRRGSR